MGRKVHKFMGAKLVKDCLLLSLFYFTSALTPSVRILPLSAASAQPTNASELWVRVSKVVADHNKLLTQ